MKRIKRTSILLVICLIVYFSISVIYKKAILNEEYFDAYILNKDITRGKNVSYDDVYKIKIRKKEYKDINLIENNLCENFLLKTDLIKGQVITKDAFVKKEDYIFDDKKEMISIKLNKNDTLTNSKLEKGSIVNIYFIKSNNDDISNKVDVIEKNVKIIDVIDENANSVSKNKDASEILVSLSSEKVLLINSYKDKGLFNISLVS